MHDYIFGSTPEMKVATNFTKNDLKLLYEQYFEPIRAFLYYRTRDMELAEDLVQEVFIKVWDKRENLKTDSVKSLLYTIANNLMINHFNHLKVVHRHEESVVRSTSIELHSPQFQIEEKEFEQKFMQVISALPDGCREVFLMNRIDKLKYQEIAERLELSVKAIEKRMSKALSIIKEQLGMKL